MVEYNSILLSWLSLESKCSIPLQESVIKITKYVHHSLDGVCVSWSCSNHTKYMYVYSMVSQTRHSHSEHRFLLHKKSESVQPLQVVGRKIMNTTLFFSVDYLWNQSNQSHTGELNKNYKIYISGKATVTHEFHSTLSLYLRSWVRPHSSDGVCVTILFQQYIVYEMHVYTFHGVIDKTQSLRGQVSTP